MSKPSPSRMSGDFVEAALSLNGCTPPRQERLRVAEASCQELGNFCLESLRDIDRGKVRPDILVPIGIYATREALFGVIAKDNVDHPTAQSVADQASSTCEYLQRRLPTNRTTREQVGFYAELGMLNMAWNGIADGELGLDYAFLLGSAGYEKNSSGLRQDVDLLARATKNGSNKPRRRKVQIKASQERADAIYGDDIVVITAPELFEEGGMIRSVSRLMNWSTCSPAEKTEAYRRFSAKLRSPSLAGNES